MQQVIKQLGAKDEECWFWATHGGAELDLLVVRGERKCGFEFKRSETPSTTRSMHSAMQDLGLERIDVVHIGPDSYPLEERIRALSVQRIAADLEPLA